MRSSDPSFRLGIAVDWPIRGGKTLPEHAYAHLSEAAPRHGFRVFLFELRDVDWTRRRVFAWIREGTGGSWIPTFLPLPDAVYNRISRRRVESSGACRKSLARLARHAPLFNPRFLDKAEVQHALERSAASTYLPPARIVCRPGAIVEAVDEFGASYVKPVTGSLGARILRAERGGRAYRVAYNVGHGTSASLRRAELTRAELAALLKRLYRGERVLVQEAVAGPTFHGRRFDIRVLVQKQPSGTWRLTGAAGRLALPGAVTTHTVRGGSCIPWAQLAKEASGPVPGIPLLEDAAQSAAQAVEAATCAEFFEFSLDVAPRPDGLPAILEVNAKPFPFDEPAIKRLAAEQLFAYARERIARRMHRLSTASRAGQ